MTRLLVSCLWLVGAVAAPAADTVTVAVSVRSNDLQRRAASELVGYLGQIYPHTQFVLAEQLAPQGKAILLGIAGSDPRLPAAGALTPESFQVSTTHEQGRQLGIIAGADARGVFYGVYALLEQLGCGFYLSYDALPEPHPGPFSFDGWKLADRPLVKDRVVFDWHNFLSGCSTWNLADWNSWTAQAQKMGFNAIMVHAYGNNPMVRFSFNGIDKPLGYLSTTRLGRDWSTNHVNDVRHLFGGAAFNAPVFGADAAQVAPAQRGPAAEALMHEVFQYAQSRGMGVVFANDVDTLSSNPQEIIRTLPESARFATGKDATWLANPETPQGNAYYRAQVQSLLRAYPQITQLVVWFRNGGTPWMDLKAHEMPASWQAEYAAAIQKTPQAAQYWHAVAIFALSKIVAAYQRTLGELGRTDIELCIGTWNFELLPAGDRFMPPAIKFYALDYGVLHGKSQLATPEAREFVRRVAEHRPIVPVAWAHHDDGTYVGRPFTPFEQFHAKLTDCRAAGFGIIHWMTRPLDLYFASLVKQVWQQTENQALDATCAEMAARSFGPATRSTMGEYLRSWVTEAPNFGRETSDHFIDRPLQDIDAVVAHCRSRIQLIDGVKQAALTPAQQARVAYHRGLEQFILECQQAQGAFQDADALLKKRDLADARRAISAGNPAEVIERFAKFTALGGMTRGEQGLLVSLNLRWLPHIVALRQALGMERIGYAIGPTAHDPLAQSPGWMTFRFEPDQRLWQVLGEQELGTRLFALAPDAKVTAPPGAAASLADLCRQGLEADRPVTIALGPIFTHHGARPVPPGSYSLSLIMLDPSATRPGQRVFDVDLLADKSSSAPLVHERIDVFRATGQTHAVLVRRYAVQLAAASRLHLTLTPVAGAAVLSGVTLEPK